MRKLLTLAAMLVLGLTAQAQDKAEAEFLANGPKLYTMDAALAKSAETGKPVVCWMGKGLFKNEAARRLSTELGETTIQAAMDTDGTEYDAIGFRVKFSTNNYKDGKTIYVPLRRFDEPGMAEKILAKVRGGN